MEEYHAVLIGNNYILISQDGQTIHTVPKMSFNHEIGDYNKVMVENKDGKFFVKQIQQNEPEGFTGVNIPRTCSTQQSLTEAGVQTAAIQAGGADAKTLFKKYKCIHKILDNGDVEDIKKIQSIIFGDKMSLTVYPLFQISETTMILLLFNTNHDVMFLTTSDAITENANVVIENPYIHIKILSIDSLGKSADIPMPWINVTTQTKLYEVEFTVKLPLYVLPIATDLKYPNSATAWLQAAQNSIQKSAAIARTNLGRLNEFGNSVSENIKKKINEPFVNALGNIQSRINKTVAENFDKVRRKITKVTPTVPGAPPGAPPGMGAAMPGGSLANAKVRKSRRAK